MLARVLDDGDSSNVFPVTNRVEQGCVLAPTVFSMMLSAMLLKAFCDDKGTRIKIRPRTDGRLFNLWRLQAKTKVEDDSLRDFLFADDCALNASTKAQMQQSMNYFFTACRIFGLTISTKKTEVLHQPAPQKIYLKPTITTEGEILKAVAKFTYLGSTLSRSMNINDEVDICIAKASSIWMVAGVSVGGERCQTVHNAKMYKAVVLPTLLYACETRTVYERHAKKLNCWYNKVPDTDVLSQAGLPSIYTLLRKA
ncbi:hypothetical protein NDU88_004416 [Pleurodeles waltl]|uniref:Reverse transcriptase domain-containing protein n=1 Tax=Pleurodeles waltl TaxID=8319 RepID=A0AAV7M8B6_PLEWA|nr:hypothetical protein NDU88_004416 [Pleurodeles waltl]